MVFYRRGLKEVIKQGKHVRFAVWLQLQGCLCLPFATVADISASVRHETAEVLGSIADVREFIRVVEDKNTFGANIHHFPVSVKIKFDDKIELQPAHIHD